MHSAFRLAASDLELRHKKHVQPEFDTGRLRRLGSVSLDLLALHQSLFGRRHFRRKTRLQVQPLEAEPPAAR
jgi:hypothetical protein